MAALHNAHPNDVVEVTRTNAFKLSDIPGYLNALQHLHSMDDRKLLLENMVALMSRLSGSPRLAPFVLSLQNALITILYKDLPHPPSSYLAPLQPHAVASNPVKYAYRAADGSNYVPLFPGIGQSGSPYARSVPASNITPPASLPNAGLVFDTLMRRDEFEPHPGGISALFFAFADLIIHTVFYTDHSDSTKNKASSYLDLAVLYGHTQADVDRVRNKDGRGRLYEDVFADGRLLLLSPAACALLVLLNRNHNYTAQKILEINERGTYVREFVDDDKMTAQQKMTAQDDEIFERARLVNCAYNMQIILGDYVGAILGLVRDGYSWRLDPLSASRELAHDLTPRGEGNVVSVEFNLLYRWHATLSKEDTAWTENMFHELFEGQEFSTIKLADFVRVAHAKLIPPDNVREWTFNKLKRGPDGRFKDDDIAEILQNSTSWRAGAYKARGIPEVLRVIEMMGIEQARRWGTCSMNDFRRFLGLKPYASFKEWNPDEKVHSAAAKLYKDIENLELYVGLQAEEAKKPSAGAGLCPGYTISRSILADAVSLVRGDRFLTVEMTPFNLTAWGFHDCQFDTQDGSYGGMLTKLLFRSLPAHYPARSAYAHFPFLDPTYMQAHMRVNNPELEGKYTWTRPNARPDAVVVVESEKGVRAVLEDEATFPSEYKARLEEVVGQGVEPAFVNRVRALILGDRERWAEYFANETERLIEKRTLDSIENESSAAYVDVVRDVINVLPVHWICQHLAGLPLDTEDLKDEQRQYDDFADVCRYVFLNSEPSNDWRLRESSIRTYQQFDKVIKGHLGSKLWFLDADRAALAESLPFLTRLHQEDRDLTTLAAALFVEVVPTAAHWSQVIAHVVNFYLEDARAQEREEIVRLAARDTKEAHQSVVKSVHAALAVDPPVWGVYRTAQKADTIIDATNIPVGTRVFASIKNANTNVVPGEAPPILGIGEHGLLSAKFFEMTVPKVLGKILGLKNLKRAPGISGKFNRFVETVHGAPQQWYVNARSDLVPCPESLVVEYTV